MSIFQEPNSNKPIGTPMLDSHSGLHYNDAGNAFVRDTDGAWIPHCGYILVRMIWSTQ